MTDWEHIVWDGTKESLEKFVGRASYEFLVPGVVVEILTPDGWEDCRVGDWILNQGGDLVVMEPSLGEEE